MLGNRYVERWSDNSLPHFLDTSARNIGALDFHCVPKVLAISIPEGQRKERDRDCCRCCQGGGNFQDISREEDLYALTDRGVVFVKIFGAENFAMLGIAIPVNGRSIERKRKNGNTNY